MTIVAHTHPFVVGVDTHAQTHALSILTTPLGAAAGDGEFPTTAAGISRAIAWVARRTGGGQDVLWVVECAATYGAQLAKAVRAAGHLVVEAARMSAKATHGVGKSDPLDARRIAAAVLPLETGRLRHLREDQSVRAALRVVIAARDTMSGERTAAINSLTALLRVTDLGIDARQPLTAAQVLEVSRWRTRAEDIAAATARTEAVRLARRVTALEEDLAQNTKALTDLLQQSPARVLLEMPGIGTAQRNVLRIP